MVITTVYKLIWPLAGQGLERNIGGVISADLSAASRTLLVPGSSSDIRPVPPCSQKGFLPTSWTLEGCGKGTEQEELSYWDGFLHARPRFLFAPPPPSVTVASLWLPSEWLKIENSGMKRRAAGALNFNPFSIESHYHKRLARAGPIPSTGSSGLLWVVRQKLELPGDTGLLVFGLTDSVNNTPAAKAHFKAGPTGLRLDAPGEWKTSRVRGVEGKEAPKTKGGPGIGDGPRHAPACYLGHPMTDERSSLPTSPIAALNQINLAIKGQDV